MLVARRSVVVIGFTVAMASGLVACGGGSSGSDETSTTASEYRAATPAEVAAGLADIDEMSARAAAAVADDPDGAAAVVDDIEAAWLRIEGTIQLNDPSAYLAFEDAIVLLRTAAQDQEPDTASRAVADLASQTDAYLDQFPR